MKRWLVILLVLLAVLILISPGIVGRLAERNIEQNIEWAEEDSPGVSIETESFQRGWFTSEGRYRVVLEGGRFTEVSEQYRQATGNPELPSLVITTKLQHGPLPGGELSPGLASSISTFQVDPGNGELFDVPGALHSKVALNGTTTSQLLLEPGSFESEDAKFEWQGTDLEIVSNPGTGSVSAAGVIKAWQISAEDSLVSVDAVSLKADQARTIYGFSVGAVDLQSGKLAFQDDETRFSIEKLSINADSALDDDRVDAHTMFALDGMTVPAFGEVDFTMEITLEDIDAASLQAIRDAANDAQQAADPEAALANLYTNVEKDVKTLFGRGFAVHVNKLDVALPQGVVATRLDFNVPAMDQDATFDWSSVLLRSTANIDLRVPGAIYEMAAMMDAQAGSLVAMGILVQDGDDYVMHAEYAQGLVNVNGVPMPIPIPGM